MSNQNQIYAAYGSNINLKQMAFRCPYATIIGTADLADHRLIFRGPDGYGVATVEPEEGVSVPVLLWEITPRDEEALDRYEGFPTLYRKEIIAVKFHGKDLEAMAYIMNEGRPATLPDAGYYVLIIDGYQSVGFALEGLQEAFNTSSLERKKTR